MMNNRIKQNSWILLFLLPITFSGCADSQSSDVSDSANQDQASCMAERGYIAQKDDFYLNPATNEVVFLSKFFTMSNNLAEDRVICGRLKITTILDVENDISLSIVDALDFESLSSIATNLYVDDRFVVCHHEQSDGGNLTIMPGFTPNGSTLSHEGAAPVSLIDAAELVQSSRNERRSASWLVRQNSMEFDSRCLVKTVEK